MHGATLLDVDGRPLRPAILWNAAVPMRSALTSTAGVLAPCDRGNSCDARLHRAQAAVGGAARAGSVRKGSKVLLPKAYSATD